VKFISEAAKEVLVKKALGQKSIYVKSIAKQNSVGYSSLKKWMKDYRSGQLNLCKTTKKPLTRLDRLEHILATAALDEQALGVYCRERGLYAVQLSEWKNEIMTEKTDEEKYQTLLAEIKTLRIENKHLKQDINRKDRALAETTALLVLKKKAAVIWGEPEDD
jgi:transposase